MLRKGQMVGSKSGNYSETAEKLVKNYQREEIFRISLEFDKKRLKYKLNVQIELILKVQYRKI